jgi:hypothetical protein
MPRFTPMYFVDPNEIDSVDTVDALKIGYAMLAALNYRDVFVREIKATEVMRNAAKLVGDLLPRGTAMPDAYRRGETRGVSPFAPARELSIKSTKDGVSIRIGRTR